VLAKRPIHPVFFALYPVLALYSLNTALIPIGDVVLPLLATLAVTCALWGVLTLAFKNAARGARGASVSVILVFLDGHVWEFVQRNPNIHDYFFNKDSMLWAWFAVWLVAMIAACWKWKKSDQMTRGMNVGGLALVAIPILSICASWFTAWRGTTVREMTEGSVKLDTSNRPDIFYVILDGYGRSDALKRVIGFSNDWFIKGLEDRGFFVAKEGHSNYCQTELSLSSSLNMNYLPEILPNLDPSWEDRKILDRLIDKNGVASYLRRIGYRYEAMTTGFPSVHPASADLWQNDAKGISLFAGVVLGETPLPASSGLAYMSQFVSRRLMIQAALENIGAAAVGGTQPRFVFAHILAPHPPFVFGPNGEPIRPARMGYTYVDGNHFFQNGGTPEEYKKGYAGQATYLSNKVLALVDQILKSSPRPPIIIFQGDHGSKLRLDQEDADKTDVNECFPNLNAYLVPAQVRAKLYDSITPVNSFRMIFDGLFGDKMPQLPDKSYYSGWSSPFRFVDITKRLKPASLN